MGTGSYNDSVERLRSYIFLNGGVRDPNNIVELAKKRLPLTYAAELEGEYSLFLETERVPKQQVERFAGELQLDYALYNVEQIHPRGVMLYPRSVAVGRCNEPVRSIDMYFQKGVRRIDIVERVNVDKAVRKENVLFHIEGDLEKADKVLNNILRKEAGEHAHANYIVAVLYPDNKDVPLSGLLKGRYTITDSVEAIRAGRES